MALPRSELGHLSEIEKLNFSELVYKDGERSKVRSQ